MHCFLLFFRRLCGCWLRLDTPGRGEFRVAVDASAAQKSLGTGYFFADGTRTCKMMKRGGVPILANDEQILLYNQLMIRIDENNKKRNRKYLQVATCLFIPFCVMLGVGDTTYGFDVNPNLFSVQFALSLAIPLVILPWVRTQDAVSICMLIPFFVIFCGDVIDGYDENFFFFSGFVLSATLPFVMLGNVPSIDNAERAWEAELVTLYYEEMPKWNDQGFCGSRVDDKRCLKMVYFSFQKIQEESEEDATVNSDSLTEGKETFVAEMV